VDTGIQTHELVDFGYDYEEDWSGFFEDYTVLEDEELRPFGVNRFGTNTGHYLSQYVTGDHPINIVYGIRKETDGTVIVGYLPLSVYEKNSFNVRGVT